MSVKTIIIIIGIILIAVAIISSLKSKEEKSTLISTKLGIPLGIVGILLIIYGSYNSNTLYVNSQMEQISTGEKLKVEGPVETIKVLSPVDKDSVDCRILTMGVYPEDNDKDIWVVLHPTDDRYYPQSDHTNTSYKRDGEWQVVTRFGGDLGEAYDLIVYEVDEETSQFFSKTIEDWKANENYPGLKESEIPEGAIEVERIVVYSAKNCRGVF